MVVVYVVLVFVLNMHVVELVVGVVDVGEVLMVRSVTSVGSLVTVVVNAGAIHQVVLVVVVMVEVVVIGLVIVGEAMVVDNADQGHARMTVKEDEDLELDLEADPETDLVAIRIVVAPAHVLVLFPSLEMIVLFPEIEDPEVGRTSRGLNLSPSQDLSPDQDRDLRRRTAKMIVDSAVTATISCFSWYVHTF